jgi:2,4-dienoyl-CoA reductase-like NADH-dependent reductase (Old Yellow Enzyme family)/thioredoxin reductase
VKYLFSKYRIRNIELKNRIVMPGLASFLGKEDGTVSDQMIEHYRRRAAGGPAMVIVEACAVSAEGIVSPNQARIDHDGFTEGLSKIADALKSEGAIPALQIHHSGRQTSANVIKEKPLAPSHLPCPTIRGEVQPLTIDGIQELVEKYAKAAIRARDANFELVEIHGAHGYLINQFLSGFSNIREDPYGGDIAGRTRFAREIVQAVRADLGKEFPLSFKISAQEFVPGGLNVSESIEILKILIQAGIDVVQVSAGNDATPEWICQPMFMKKACLVESAAEIKKKLDIPVMTVGRINDPMLADKIIQNNKADLVCMGRGLLADPEMPKKMRSGRFDDIRICIACNTCIESIFKKGRVECLVNPTLGRETKMTIQPAEEPKKIMVIGGGPGGLNAAWVAASRGHEVHLFEKSHTFGGQLFLGSTAGFKKELKSLIKFFLKQIEKFNVHCHLNHEVSAETIQREKPDAIILATGSLPTPLPIEGIEKKIVVPIQTALNGDRPLKEKTVVVGGGPTGCEVALYLSEYGCSVTMVEMLPEIGGRLEFMTRRIFIEKLIGNQVQMMTGYRLVKVADGGIFVIDNENNKHFIETQHVVMAVGNRPDNNLYEQIASLGYEMYKIGDCIEPRSAKEAIYESMLVARTI